MDNAKTTKSLSNNAGVFGKAWQAVIDSYRIFENKFWPLFIISFIGSLAYAGGTTSVAFAIAFVFAAAASTSTLLHFIIPFLIGVLSVLFFILQIWSGIALITVANSSEKADIVKSFLSTRNKLISYVWTGFLGFTICAGLMVFLIIPGLVVSVWFSLSTILVVTENKRGLEALFTSKELIKNHWRETALFLALVGLILLVVFYASAILQLPPQLWSLFINTLSGAFWAAALVALYRKLSVGKTALATDLSKSRRWRYVFLAFFGTTVIVSSLVSLVYLGFEFRNDALRMYEGTQIQQALADYKQKQGSFPSDLSQLVPGFLPAIPLDPATQKPFGYALTNDGKDYFLIIDYDHIGIRTLTGKAPDPLPNPSGK